MTTMSDNSIAVSEAPPHRMTSSDQMIDDSRSLSDRHFDSLDEEVLEDDDDDRLSRSRDRNREHARRTRLRKKAQLQTLQNRVKDLQDESRMLKQTLEECSIASILLGLSAGENTDQEDAILELNASKSCNAEKTFFTVTGKRKRFVSVDGDSFTRPMTHNIKGKMTIVGGGDGKAQINWKTGIFIDENGNQQQLSADELEVLR